MAGRKQNASDLAQTKSATVADLQSADLAEFATLPDWLSESGQQLSLVQPESFEHALDLAADAINHANGLHAVSGYYLLAAKASMPHGQWGQWLAGRKIPARTATRNMRVAQLLQRLPEAQRSQYVAMPKRVLTSLARLDDEQLELMVTTHEPDEVSAMPRDQLEQAYRERCTDLDTREAQLETAQRQLQNRSELPQPTQWPEWVSTTRETAAVYGDRAMLAIDELEQLAATLPNQLALTDSDDTHKRVAVSSAVAHVGAIAARASQVLALYQERFGDHIEADQTKLPIADLDEVKRLLVNRQLVVGEHENAAAAKALRADDAQAAEQPKKRGRPAGSKNKKAAA